MDFKEHILVELGIKNMITVEMSFGERSFVITEANNPQHVQVQSNSELWFKENLWNIGLSRIPKSAKYVAFIDADIRFLNKNVVCDAIHALQRYDVIQMHESVLDLGARGEVCQVHTSLGYCHVNDILNPYGDKKHYLKFGHPGMNMCFRKDTLEKLGGFIDRAILGSADHHMWLCFIGKGADSLPNSIHPEYRKMIMDYQALCDVHLKKNIGYISGSIVHSFHGKKASRKYRERWDVLIKNKYDPTKDVYKNLHGVLELTGNKIKLRDDIRKYFDERNEDFFDTCDYNDTHK